MTRLAPAVLLLAASLSGGCAALTNPVADGVPVRRLPAEVLGRPRADMRQIPLTVLQQREPDPYRLDKGDILAVVADDLVTISGQLPPVKLPDGIDNTAALGVPIPVSDEGTITVGRLEPLPVRGLSVLEVETLIREVASGQRGGPKLLRQDARLSVQIQKRRTYRVSVVREDGQGPSQVQGQTRSGRGFVIDMRAGENDVLRAINLTGGTPGLDARNEVTVFRNLKAGRPFDPNLAGTGVGRKQLVMNGEAVAVRIPLRLYPEQPLTVSEEDVILKEGDLLLIEARDTEVYYTAGLIGAGQFPLPRDYDLDVIQAIAQVRGPLLNGGFSQNAFVANSVGQGLGSPSPSLCTVLRKVSPTRQIPIRVDLNRAFQDPRERILILPGDTIVLQENTGESITRYLTQTVRLATTGTLLSAGSFATGLTANGP